MGRVVDSFNESVLRHLRRVGDGQVRLDSCQLAELPTDLGALIAAQVQDVADAGSLTRLTGKTVQPSPSKVDMGRLMQYFSTEAVDAESPLSDNTLDHPLSNYFVNTSHNTYLTGNQLYGNASTEAYKTVLRHGCRSIEIDVWDGKAVGDVGMVPDDADLRAASKFAEPRVLHGHTLTKEVSFREVCKAINEAAFQTSEMPVIVSLEVHAHAEQQARMVQIMTEVWGQKLVPAPEEECHKLPSPHHLRGKILVKVKGTAIGQPEDTLNEFQKTSTRDSNHLSGDESSSDEQVLTDPGPSGTAKAKSPGKIIEELSAMGVYTRAYKFRNFSLPEASIPTHVFSLSEKKVMTVHENDGASLFRHNQDFLMRVYPSGSRVTSSNLDPPAYWRKGIQMVALNWQRVDASIMLNRAMFSGSLGYVLKPIGYRSPIALSETSGYDSVPRCRMSFQVEVMAAQSLPPAKRPYVKCELHAETSRDRRRQKGESEGRSKDGEYKRRTKVSKTLDFQSEIMEFGDIQEVVTALTFVRFKVMDDVLGPDELVAWACVRLDRLKPGVRFLHLSDPRNNNTNAVLLVNIRKLCD